MVWSYIKDTPFFVVNSFQEQELQRTFSFYPNPHTNDVYWFFWLLFDAYDIECESIQRCPEVFAFQTLSLLLVFSGLSSAPSSWAVINLDRQSRALIAKGSELCLIDHGGQYQVQVQLFNWWKASHIYLKNMKHYRFYFQIQ